MVFPKIITSYLRYIKALVFKDSLVSTREGGFQLEEEEGRAFSSKRRRTPQNLKEDSRREEDSRKEEENQPKPLLSSLLTPFFTSDLEDNSKGKPQP